jgi:hypothetical protein
VSRIAIPNPQSAPSAAPRADDRPTPLLLSAAAAAAAWQWCSAATASYLRPREEQELLEAQGNTRVAQLHTREPVAMMRDGRYLKEESIWHEASGGSSWSFAVRQRRGEGQRQRDRGTEGRRGPEARRSDAIAAAAVGTLGAARFPRHSRHVRQAQALEVDNAVECVPDVDAGRCVLYSGFVGVLLAFFSGLGVERAVDAHTTSVSMYVHIGRHRSWLT